MVFIAAGFDRIAAAKSVPEPVETTRGLRNMILSLKPSEVGISPSKEYPNVWGIVMEIGFPSGLVTLVAMADGTTSLYQNRGQIFS